MKNCMQARRSTALSITHPRRLRAFGSILSLASLLALGACSSDGDSDTGDGDGDTGEDMLTLKVDLTGLEPLAGGFEYEGWFINDNGPVSAGRFNLTGGESSIEVMVDADAADGAIMYVLTIEPPTDEDDPAPSATHVLAGPWENDAATLSIDADAALGGNFSSAAGEFFLQTPTSSKADDYSLGIWFITPGDTMSAGLTLPELPEGWAYEGWVAGPDGPVSTGLFLDAAAADDDGAGPAAGDQDAPPFPGQDYIDPELDLLGDDFIAVISVEPQPDDSPAPFAFKPLVGSITDEGAGGVQPLDNMSDNAPAGSVEVMN